jgi:hypothetical protein
MSVERSTQQVAMLCREGKRRRSAVTDCWQAWFRISRTKHRIPTPNWTEQISTLMNRKVNGQSATFPLLFFNSSQRNSLRLLMNSVVNPKCCPSVVGRGNRTAGPCSRHDRQNSQLPRTITSSASGRPINAVTLQEMNNGGQVLVKCFCATHECLVPTTVSSQPRQGSPSCTHQMIFRPSIRIYSPSASWRRS